MERGAELDEESGVALEGCVELAESFYGSREWSATFGPNSGETHVAIHRVPMPPSWLISTRGDVVGERTGERPCCPRLFWE